MRQNIKLSLYKLAVLQLLALLNNVIEKLSTNVALFPTPPITLVAMELLSAKFNTAIMAATEGGVAARKERDSLVVEVRSVLRTQADYVRSVCGGDAAKLAKSGYVLSKMPEPINEVGIPQRVKADATDEKGNILVRWSKTTGGRLFRVEQASGDPAMGDVTWVSVALTGRQRAVLVGMEAFKAHYFRIIAIGITHEGLPSDIVMGRAA